MKTTEIHRRKFIQNTVAASVGLPFWHRLSDNVHFPISEVVDLSGKLPVRSITGGPQQHWFGYYDKQQISANGRYALSNQVDLFFRSPTLQDTLQVGLIDLENNNQWQKLGQSSAWGWQQGCMLQWLPGSSEEVIWNARLEDSFVSIIYNVKTGQRRILPKPIYTLSPDGRTGFGIDFARLQFFRPGYGYATTDTGTPVKAPEDTGIYRMDLQSGKSQLILSYAALAKLERSLGSVAENYHWINHLLVNPSGNRLIFLNRSRPYPTKEEYLQSMDKELRGGSSYVTRAVTANPDGSDLYALNDSGRFSHFIWKGNDTLCAWSAPEDKQKEAFYLFQDQSKDYRMVGEETMTKNGHNTYVPNTNYGWILNDTYPQGEKRMQELYLYHVPSKRKIILGRFHEPKKFSGEWRCDLHPRCNPQGTAVFFNSTHEGDQRQMYMIEIKDILDA